MKLSTLLLSSAALVVAGAAYAADLPAKKAAPAAAAPTGCPAFGAGFFQVPGSDTCIQFSGYAAYEGKYDNTSGASGYTQGGEGRIRVDTASNTDLGALKTRIRMTAATSGGYSGATSNGSFAVSRAYGSLGGFKFGRDDSHADIGGVGAGGTYAWNGGTGLGGGTGTGMWYSTTVGSATIEVGEENAVADGASPQNMSNRPDILAKAAFTGGPATFTVMGISHAPKDSVTGSMGSGYAFLANVMVTQGDFGASVFGGTSQGALKYTALPSGYTDSTNGNLSKGTNFGAELTYAIGAGKAAVFAGQSTANDAATSNTTTVNYADVEIDYPVAKGLFVTPEVYFAGGTTSTQTYYLTIHRDF